MVLPPLLRLRLLYAASVLCVAAGAAWIAPPLGLIVAGAMLWWDLHGREGAK